MSTNLGALENFIISKIRAAVSAFAGMNEGAKELRVREYLNEFIDVDNWTNVWPCAFTEFISNNPLVRSADNKALIEETRFRLYVGQENLSEPYYLDLIKQISDAFRGITASTGSETYRFDIGSISLYGTNIGVKVYTMELIIK